MPSIWTTAVLSHTSTLVRTKLRLGTNSTRTYSLIKPRFRLVARLTNGTRVLLEPGFHLVFGLRNFSIQNIFQIYLEIAGGREGRIHHLCKRNIIQAGENFKVQTRARRITNRNLGPTLVPGSGWSHEGTNRNPGPITPKVQVGYFPIERIILAIP